MGGHILWLDVRCGTTLDISIILQQHSSLSNVDLSKLQAAAVRKVVKTLISVHFNLPLTLSICQNNEWKMKYSAAFIPKFKRFQGKVLSVNLFLIILDKFITIHIYILEDNPMESSFQQQNEIYKIEALACNWSVKSKDCFVSYTFRNV